MEHNSCPIWKTPARVLLDSRDGLEIDSPRAGGRYFVSGTAVSMLQSWDDPLKVLLTSWLVEQRQKMGISCPDISSDTLKKAVKREQLSLDDRQDNLLRYLGVKSDILGRVIKFYLVDKVKTMKTVYELLAWTASRELSEVITLADICGEQGKIEYRVNELTGSFSDTIHEMMLKPLGYARLKQIVSNLARADQAFVAMWFDESMDEAYKQGIEPAIRKAGYESLRIDQKEHNNKIDDEIFTEIKRSRFLVADFTQGKFGARGGVYFEAGFAKALNIPVIFTCHEDSLDHLHFDTRQYNHISWKTPEDLLERLAQRISATIGDGPSKKS